MSKLKQKILIIEDEKTIGNFIRTILLANGYEVIFAQNGTSAYPLLHSHCPDLLILDLGLPDMDGMDIIANIRSWSQIPIIVVSARMRERDKVLALDAGADDYVTKPFGTSELLARIRTALRHAENHKENQGRPPTGILQMKDLVVDYDKRQVFLEGENVNLTQNEYRIVALLGRHAGKVLTYDTILQELWGKSARGDNQILRVNMANIRRKIEKNSAAPEYIFTEMGVGYRMTDQS